MNERKNLNFLHKEQALPKERIGLQNQQLENIDGNNDLKNEKREHLEQIPHHFLHVDRPVPGHVPPHRDAFRNIISVLYTEEKMKSSFGPFWGRECENISKEPAEIKMVFALLMGFQVCLNRPLSYEERTEPSVDFIADIDMGRLSERLGIDEGTCSFIIKKAPDGIVTIIKGLLEK